MPANNSTPPAKILSKDGEGTIVPVGPCAELHVYACKCNWCEADNARREALYERFTESDQEFLLRLEREAVIEGEAEAALDKAFDDQQLIGDFAVHTRVLTTEPQPKQPTLLTRSDGETLLYAGRFNSIHGLPKEGKTWVSIFCVVEAIRAGSRVAIWDFEDRAVTTATRLQAIGAMDVLESPDLVYIAPTLKADPKAKTALRTWLNRGEGVGLMVIDAAESSGAPSDGKDVMPWLGEIVDPWKEGELTIAVIDHTPKQKEDRPRGQIGSGRKLAAVDGAALFVTGVPWTKTSDGVIKMINHGDRGGDLPVPLHKVVATITGKHKDGVLTYSIDPPNADGSEDSRDLTDQLLEQIALRGDEGVRTGENVRNLIKGGKAIEKDYALKDLLAMGLVSKTEDGRAFVYTVTEAGYTELTG